MDRMQNVNQTDFDRIRAECQRDYPGKSEPLPGTALKLDDDVLWLGVIPVRVLWGYDDPDFFNAFNAEMLGTTNFVLEGQYIEDRAPADPQETPMPIYPQQAQQPQHGKQKHDRKAALKRLLDQLPHDAEQRVRKLVHEKRPALLK